MVSRKLQVSYNDLLKANGQTDLRTVLAHVSQWLPIQEVAGLRLFPHELREFGLLDDENENQKLAGYFKMPEAV
jgi:hypothetical protein